MNRRLHLLSALLFTAGCGGPSPSGDGANADPNCQPINEAGGECLLPFPSAYYQKTDESSATKLRLALPSAALPANPFLKQGFDPARWNRLDGYSPGTRLLANLKARVDPTKLPRNDYGDYAPSTRPESTVQLLELPSGERVPLFAEVDANVVDRCQADSDCGLERTCQGGRCAPDEDQLLIVQPMVKLKPATRYVAVLRDLVATDGKAITVRPFRALVDGQLAPGSPLAKVQGRYQEIFTFLEGQGVPRSALTLAWDFVTASDKQAWGDAVVLRDAALKRVDQGDLGFEVAKVDERNDESVRVISGTFKVPSFLTSLTDPYATLRRDGSFKPLPSGELFPARFVVNVPKCALAAGKTVPVVIYGHGLFGDAGEVTSGAMRGQANGLCMIHIATNWVGMAEADETWVSAKVFKQFDAFPFISDRLQQGQANFAALARLVRTKLKEVKELKVKRQGGAASFDPAGEPLVDGKEIYYSGNSQGGINGGTFMTLTPDVSRGLLGVPGSNYSILLTRSTDFLVFKTIMNSNYPRQRDQEILLMMAQSFWDQSEPAGYVHHAILDPLPDENGKPMAPKRLLLHEGRYDGQVHNLGSHYLARQAGIAGLAPMTYPVYLVPAKEGPLDSAYVSWDVHPMPIFADNNVPPERDNEAHGAVRRLPEVIEQLRRFFRPDGKVEQTCAGGPCEKGKGIK